MPLGQKEITEQNIRLQAEMILEGSKLENKKRVGGEPAHTTTALSIVSRRLNGIDLAGDFPWVLNIREILFSELPEVLFNAIKAHFRWELVLK